MGTGLMTGSRKNYELAINETSIATRSKSEIKEPKLYKVLIHNDDYTPMEFVVLVLKEIFNKDATLATKIMLDVHNKGVGVCGIYPLEIAETKMNLVLRKAREKEFPLRCTLEVEQN